MLNEYELWLQNEYIPIAGAEGEAVTDAGAGSGDAGKEAVADTTTTDTIDTSTDKTGADAGNEGDELDTLFDPNKGITYTPEEVMDLRNKLEKAEQQLQQRDTKPVINTDKDASDVDKLLDEMYRGYDKNDPNVRFWIEHDRKLLQAMENKVPTIAGKLAEEKLSNYEKTTIERQSADKWNSEMDKLQSDEKTDLMDRWKVTSQFIEATNRNPNILQTNPNLLWELARRSHLENERKMAERIKGQNTKRIDNANDKKKKSTVGGGIGLGTLQPEQIKDFDGLAGLMNKVAAQQTD